MHEIKPGQKYLIAEEALCEVLYKLPKTLHGWKMKVLSVNPPAGLKPMKNPGDEFIAHSFDLQEKNLRL